ncbi:hypothetical protein [uncultured Thiodictyon sp.]|uniref:hypothetical protein n=1 Tax=uncultured Thiodictyon sp. TaxID=1846217 RepID=UPI0025CCFC37|nr:hypothetical protein [uncultured Thiodictyon sp.]
MTNAPPSRTWPGVAGGSLQQAPGTPAATNPGGDIEAEALAPPDPGELDRRAFEQEGGTR